MGLGLEAVDRSYYLNVSIWLKEEGDRGAGHLVTHARRSSLDYSAHPAKGSEVLMPGFEKLGHSHSCLFRQIFGQNGLHLLDQVGAGVLLLASEGLERRNGVDVEVGVATAVELVINLEDPHLHVEVSGDELREGVHELILVENVNTTDRGGHIG